MKSFEYFLKSLYICPKFHHSLCTSCLKDLITKTNQNNCLHDYCDEENVHASFNRALFHQDACAAFLEELKLEVQRGQDSLTELTAAGTGGESCSGSGSGPGSGSGSASASGLGLGSGSASGSGLDSGSGSSIAASFILVIDGQTLSWALQEELKSSFLELSRKCKAVICCRSTPLQKSQVVRLIQDQLGAMTLAVGKDSACRKPARTFYHMLLADVCCVYLSLTQQNTHP